jgi:hypothetical protein
VKLWVPSAVKADLSWVQFLLTHLPNKVPLALVVPIDLGWWGDASTSFGVGVVIGTHWAVWKWVPGFVVGLKQQYNIGWAEAVAIELGLHMAIHLGLIEEHRHSNQVLLVHSDNAGVVAVTNKG